MYNKQIFFRFLVLNLFILNVFGLTELLASSFVKPFTGITMGINGGAGQVKQQHIYTDPTGVLNTVTKNKFLPVYGVHLGAMVQNSKKLVIGGEFFFRKASGVFHGELFNAQNTRDGYFKVWNKFFAGANIQAGPLLNPKFWTYAIAGYLITQTKFQYYDLQQILSPKFRHYQRILKGPYFGAGAAFALSSHVIFAIEHNMMKPQPYTVVSNAVAIDGVKRNCVYGPTFHFGIAKLTFLF